MQVLVLGAGPAGLMAAHAAAITNNDVLILSKKRKSYMRGAQYLHMPIPMASQSAPFEIEYALKGTSEQYRDKVYGPDPRIKVSPDSLLGSHLAWDIREAYDWLWETYSTYVHDREITPWTIEELLKTYGADMVISSIPAQEICQDPSHVFQRETVWVTEFFRGTFPGDNYVECSGDPDDPWYRTSRIQGWTNTEYPFAKKPPLSGDKVHEVAKPIKTNCDCLPDVRRVGRYGTWTKGVLSHTAFYDTADVLSKGLALKEHNQ
ncbi:oxidoreductase [Arthrobacter phage Wollypog]|uniref:Oxidoreductase n=1 Tax=Arthrobacter phage Wollypog TaxID=2790985 RepID=A0A7T3KCE8_9CAUD|nr:oxidoreductase [Arthrobacter phage Wollypog]QPX62604.1 oxidoreductase [Arthrobacter phage Wollypog]